MCGITGYYSFHPATAQIVANVLQSNEKQIKRGPDTGKVFTCENVALGHRRLSIIDTSDKASQPMSDVKKRYVLVFNGEIFNFQALAEQHLINEDPNLGPLKTHSDTEVLLHLLVRYGVACLPWLNGFFAFSFFDRTTGEMIVARDPFGKKPLIYHYSEQGFAFSSEMKALLEWNVPRELDFTVLYEYLQLNYVPGNVSMIKGVKKLAPGHYLLLDKHGLKTERAYYELKCNTSAYDRYTYDQAQVVLREKMDEAVRERMLSDVPLGAFLSGGIDSSVVVALASRHTKQLNTFSVGYKNNSFFDETKYAKAVADRYATNHHVFSLANEDFLAHVFGVLDYIDEPFADSSAIPVYILSKLTREHVTVALSGDGADEVFSGYNKHMAEWRMRNPSTIARLVNLGGPLWDALPHSRNNKFTNIFRQLSRFAEGSKLNAQERYWRWASFNTPQQAKNLLSAGAKASVVRTDFERLKNNLLHNIKTNDFNEVLQTDMQLVLGGDMLVKVDMMSMANSLEVRSPFLAKDVVDFAFSLPASFKIDGKMKKKIVQDAFRDMLPPELYDRPKHGFEIPMLDWLRNDLSDLIENDLLADEFVAGQGIFDVQAIRNLKTKLKSANPEDSHATVWALIVFQYWWKKYLA